ncbi:hypothetical protein PABG_12265 [Paracoccidioides brasiliensis Pb03]|uniref:Uncharacterized protein n=1 Tax=Paracoccidioides brasiliensis TaxID=121759 RepID=A0A1D2JB15_PARBR|nr:hypothetical protein PABG_12265 [Paracoccidioides brasiliensis Pb03]ODH24711.1 hypothetical protein ACO22_05266 [Paracoccidioides brasiliensis]ODH53363.1 hypothetical protein GX48_00561 [Paracoccidioides brasiliensis]
MYADNIYVGLIIDQDRPSPSQWVASCDHSAATRLRCRGTMLSRVSNRQNSSCKQIGKENGQSRFCHIKTDIARNGVNPRRSNDFVRRSVMFR